MDLRYRLKSRNLQKLRRLEEVYATDPQAALETFELSWDNLTEAHGEIVGGLDADPTLRRFAIGFARYGWRFLLLRRDAETGIRWLEPAVESAAAVGKKRLQARLLGYLATSRLNLGAHRRAADDCRRALELLDEVDDGPSERRAELLHLLGLAHRATGDEGAQARALERFEEALEVVRQHDRPALEGRILIDSGNVRANGGNYAAGLEHYERAATALARARGESTDAEEARRQGFIGNALRNLGRYDEADASYRRSIELFDALGDPQQSGVQLFNLALTYRDQGRFAEQKEVLEKALTHARQLADDRGMGKVLNGLGTYYAYAGDLEKAVDHHERGLASLRQARAGFIVAYGQADLAQTYLLHGRVEQAIETLFGALDFAVKIDHDLLLLQRRTLLARCHLQRSELGLAQEQIELARAREGSSSTAASRHVTAALHGIVLRRRAAEERAETAAAERTAEAARAFRDALDFVDDVLDYTAPYVVALAHAGLATCFAAGSERDSSAAAAAEAYADGLERCRVDAVVRDQLVLLEELGRLDRSGEILASGYLAPLKGKLTEA